MSDTRERDPQKPSTAPEDDEDIIELVEEIGEEGPIHPLSALERNLLDIDDHQNAAGRAFDDLPDIADLSRIDFEEEEEVVPERGSAAEETGGKTSALFEPDAPAAFAASGKHPATHPQDVEEIEEFDEQFLDAEDLLEGLPTAPEDIASGEDEDLELLDIEEDDGDDEIVWFDDLDKLDQKAPLAEPIPEEVESEAPLLDSAADSVEDMSAADVFAAHVESAQSGTDTNSNLAAAVEGTGPKPAAAAEAARIQTPAESPTDVLVSTALDTSPPAVPGLAAEEIEAAVERVLARKLGGTIEAIILQAIEKAVSKEIERLKSLLLEEEAGDRTP